MRNSPVQKSICGTILAMLVATPLAWGQSAAQVQAQTRVRGPIDNRQVITLRGNTHPLARPEYDLGGAPNDLPTNRMVLLLSRPPEQQAALEKLLAEQHDKSSPNYLHWLTPAEMGEKFGPSDADVATVTNWLAQQGFAVEHVSAGKTEIEFSGTAERVQEAFHTQIHRYAVNGSEYWANAEDPEIPAALAPVVRGVVSMNDFPRRPQSHRFGLFTRQQDGTVTPAYTTGGGYYALGPADFATIYNTSPLLQAGNNGAGQTIAVLGLSNVHLSDVASFRTLFNLGTGNVSVVIDGPDPGIVSGDEGESVLDLEWTSAVAPGATVMLVSAQDTATTSGLDLAALHVIDNNLAGVMSVSYGLCEAYLGTTENAYIQSLWQQAAAQGITVLVSSGDSGSAGCDRQSSTKIAQHGLGVNGFASTPYNVAIGGTDFDDAGSQTTYWSTTNDSTTHASAKGYIPEKTWNSTCAASSSAGNLNVCPTMPTSGVPASGSGLETMAAGGGTSGCTVATTSGGATQCQSGTPKPSWQSGTGVPADGVRDLPDVSLFAAVNTTSKSMYIVCQSDTTYGSVCYPGSSFSFLGTGGTSASAASFAGVVALADQKAGTRLGNLNYELYALAGQAGASCGTGSGGTSCMFNDVVSGNISVPCTAGTPNCSATSGTTTGVLVDASGAPAYAAATGYDLATGLGTVNVTNLVNGIANAVKNASATSLALTLNGSTAAVTAQHGDSISVGVNVTPASSGAVSLLGKAGGIDTGTLNAGSATWNSRMFPGGSYTVTAHYPGDTTHAASDSNGVAVTVNPEASQVLLGLVTFDAKGNPTFNATSLPYGSPYILRAEVADAAATVSSTGVSSTCSRGIASCATGTLALTANGSPLDGGTFALNSKGYAEDWAIQLPAGTYTLAGSYAGDASYSGSTGTSAVTVTKAPTTLIAGTAVVSPLGYGSPAQTNAQLSTNSSGVAPGGQYSFNVDGVVSQDVVRNYVDAQAGAGTNTAKAVYYGWYIPSTLGTHTLYANYLGDANYQASDSSGAPFTVTVGKAGTYSNYGGVSPNTALTTTQVNLTMNVSTPSVLAEPTGTITFYDNGTALTGTVAYSGHAGSGAYSSALLQGQLAQKFATGTHTITATYSGDSLYNGTTNTLGTLTVYDKLPTSITLTSELNPTIPNYATTLTATLSGPTFSGAPAPTGTMTFYDNGQPLSGTVSYTAGYGGTLTATLKYAFTTIATHSVTASYSGDDAHASSSTSSPMLLTVADKLPTTTSMSGNGSAVNHAVALMATVSGPKVYAGPVMGGTVTFSEGGTPLAGTVTLEPYAGYLIARLTYTFTTAGVHNVIAQYSGDQSYAASQSQVAPWNILGPLGLDISQPNQTMPSTGGSQQWPVSVINTTGSPMTVALSCASDSSKASCSLSSSSVTVNANSAGSVMMTYTVPRLGAAVHRHDPFTLPFVLAGVLAGLPWMGRRKRALTVVLIALGLVLIMTSCGGGGGGSTGSNSTGNTGGTGNTVTSQVYHFTVNATSGSYSDSKVLTVTVQ